MRLKIFCKHRWRILNKTVLKDSLGWRKTIYVLVCKKCGKVKKVKIKQLDFFIEIWYNIYIRWGIAKRQRQRTFGDNIRTLIGA